MILIFAIAAKKYTWNQIFILFIKKIPKKVFKHKKKKKGNEKIMKFKSPVVFICSL